MRFANTMPGVAVVGDAGGIVGEFRNAASSGMPPASPTTATPGMVLANLTIFRDGQSF